MTDGSRSPISLRQVLWVAAGVVCLTFLVVVASWLFSPRTKAGNGVAGTASIQEGTVDKQSFTPEPPGPGRKQSLPSSAPTPSYSENGTTRPEPTASGPSATPSATPSRSVSPQPAESTPAPPPPQTPATSERTRPSRDLYGIQVGAFSSNVNARQVQHRLQVSGYPSSILEKGNVHKVVVTGFASREAAARAMADLRRKGFPKAFIVPLE